MHGEYWGNIRKQFLAYARKKTSRPALLFRR
jgi:hypothetical protein